MLDITLYRKEQQRLISLICHRYKLTEIQKVEI